VNVTVVLPSLNPDEKMVNTVKGLLKEGFEDIVVVDDGSDEPHKKYFEEVAALAGVHVLTHEKNQGKGRAMKTAFAYIMNNRSDISGVVTVDGDGQHLPKDIRKCVETMEVEKDKVILGVRDFSGADVPARSRFGNNLTKGVFRLACGIKISDTQTGLRAIPFQYLPIMIQIEGERYEYETNQLLIIKKQKIEMKEVVIETVYLDDNSSSHFHPIRDSLKIYEVIFKFLASSLCSFVVDITLFTIINMVLAHSSVDAKIRLLVATAGARLISSLVNYTMNRKVVFQSEESVGSSLPRYYLLCVCQAAASYGLVYLFVGILFHLNGSILETLIKFIVDMCLFFVSFRIQQRWVFKK
jgi:glycosyltransferase involved in cell wall biosynthesis